jgi:hypothetical protein
MSAVVRRLDDAHALVDNRLPAVGAVVEVREFRDHHGAVVVDVPVERHEHQVD